jgi:hypothetical protein
VCLPLAVRHRPAVYNHRRLNAGVADQLSPLQSVRLFGFRLLVDFIAGGTTPKAVADYHPSPEAQRRIAGLVAREKEGSLSVEEKSELDNFMDLEHMLRVAKARARQILASGS